MVRFFGSIAALSSLLLAGAAQAAGPALKPGKWEVEYKTEIALAQQPLQRKLTQCIEEGNTTPVAQLVRNSKCRTTNRKVAGNTETWDMECDGSKAGGSKGHGEFTSDGNTGVATLEMTATFQGKPLTSKTTWSGKRIGECDPPK